jgi:transcription antitermination protein NusB
MSRPDDQRSEARERAMILLYEAEQRDIPLAAVLDSQVSPADDLTRMLVEGVDVHHDEIDGVITEHSDGWSLERMPTLDRTVLRIATFELVHRRDVPTAVVIDEAVELAKRFSTDDSGRFVNGVLSATAASIRG